MGQIDLLWKLAQRRFSRLIKTLLFTSVVYSLLSFLSSAKAYHPWAEDFPKYKMQFLWPAERASVWQASAQCFLGENGENCSCLLRRLRQPEAGKRKTFVPRERGTVKRKERGGGAAIKSSCLSPPPFRTVHSYSKSSSRFIKYILFLSEIVMIIINWYLSSCIRKYIG